MREAFERVTASATMVGARFLIVHPKNPKLNAYYEKFGFQELGDTGIMVLSIKRIDALLRQLGR